MLERDAALLDPLRSRALRFTCFTYLLYLLYLAGVGAVLYLLYLLYLLALLCGRWRCVLLALLVLKEKYRRRKGACSAGEPCARDAALLDPPSKASKFCFLSSANTDAKRRW
jgi:hypothetical protein